MSTDARPEDVTDATKPAPTPDPAPARARRSRPRPSAALVLGAVLVALIVGMALVSLVWTPHDPNLVAPTDRMRGPSGEYLLGTDRFGRDQLSWIMVGARTTLLVGLVAVGIAALIGVPLGIVAGMSRGRLGRLIMRAADILLAFPALLLAIMLAAIYQGGTVVAMVAIGIASIPTFIRVVRSGTLQVMQSEYILAARVAGRRPFSIGLRHVLPNVASLIIVQASIGFAMAVLAEAALSFLGLGTSPSTPSWGRMLNDSQQFLDTTPRLAIVPGVAIALAVLGFNLLGDGLRDRLDPRRGGRR